MSVQASDSNLLRTCTPWPEPLRQPVDVAGVISAHYFGRSDVYHFRFFKFK